jgi:hypothetical protein
MPNTVYLLHFDTLHRTRHYVGITKSDRLFRRMIEHAQARGGSTTARLIRQSSGFWLVHCWHGANFSTERRIKNAGHLRRSCPLCTPSLLDPGEAHNVHRFHASPPEIRRCFGNTARELPEWQSRLPLPVWLRAYCLRARS